jgi:asparagine synthase (glutamine-hydrolysing)
MKQIAISLNHSSGHIDLQLEGDTATAAKLGSFSKWQRPNWTIVCWGDPANQGDDCGIVQSVLSGNRPTLWGRSWLAINHAQRVIHGSTDHLGLFPIFCYETDRDVVLSANRATLLTRIPNAQLRPGAMRSLVAFGQLFQDEALIKDTRCFMGRTQFTAEVQRKCMVTVNNSPLLGGWETSFDTALEALVESVRLCFTHHPHPLISLSGGLDSRLILAAAIALGKKPVGLCYGHHNSSDVKIARLLAREANIPLFTGSKPKKHLDWSLLKRVAQLGGGEVALHHAHAVLDPELLAQTQHQVILTGTGAETSRAFYYDRGMPGYMALGQRWFNSRLMQRATQYVEQEFMKTAQPFFDIAPHHQQAMMTHLRKQIHQHTESFHTPALYLDNFYLQHRVPKMVGAGQQMLDQHYSRSHPFLNKDALFYMAHLPIRYKLASTFHRKAIAKLAPRLANIVWDKTDSPLNYGLTWQQRYPALASVFGMNYWGKNATTMFDYEHLLKSLPSALKHDSLTKMQCIPDEQDSHQWDLVNSNTVLAGFSSVWSFLNTSDKHLLRKSA